MLARRSFGVIVFASILRWYFQVHGVTTIRGFLTEILTLTAVTGVRELSLIGVAFHGKVDILLENTNNPVNQNHHIFHILILHLRAKKIIHAIRTRDENMGYTTLGGYEMTHKTVY